MTLDQHTVVDGRYRVLARVGSGGMADVYCAEDLQLGRRVALKLLHRRFAEDQEFVERFRREAQSAAGLQHPNVVSVFDRGEWDGTSYIAMEYVDGENLKEVILREAPLHPDRAVDIALQILRAARFAHRQGVIHRDLKPHNVLLDREGRAKVADFGIARAGASDMTETGSILGTAQYLSPEQAQGHAVSASSDLYAIGVVLYEMLTGRVPFEGDSAVTIALKHVSEHPLPPGASNPAVGPALEAAVLRALDKDPARRHADADAFIADLEAARDGTAVASPDGADTTAFAPVAAEREVVVAEEPERRSRWWVWALLALLLAGAVAAALLLSGEAERRPVPEVVGADVAAAVQRLRNDGFQPVVERVRNRAEEDTVIGQDPEPGTRLEVGEEVALTVSTGPGDATVPSVEGLTRRSAERRLERAGFEVDVRRASDDEVPEGRVIRSSPSAGSQARIGSTVTLVVSSGPEQVTVPGVVGEDVEDARSRLQDAGLRVSVSREESDRAPGTVLRQAPGAGAEVDRGSTVSLVVAEEPDEVQVPDVTGLDATEAAERLSAAGLRIDTRTEPVERPSQDDVVLSQRPSGGTAPRNSTVTLVIGRFEPDLQPDPQPEGGEAEPTPPPAQTGP